MILESYLTGQVRKSEIIVLFLVALSFIAGIFIYSRMPEQMASHWNSSGQVDGYMSRFWGVFLLPIIFLVMAVLFIIIPRIDPLKSNIQQFRKYFDGFIILIFLFFLYIYGLTIYWNLENNFNMTAFMIPAMAVLLYYCGILINSSKRNWSIGIKTPWTMSSDVVWDKTHRIGGKLFKASGVICLLGLIWPCCAMWFVLAPILLSTIFVFVYSYLEFKKLNKVA